MLTIAICDDDLDFAKRFNASLKKGFEHKEIQCKTDVFGNADDLLGALDQQYYDIICLDIEIGMINGVTIGNTIRDKLKNQKSQIIFMSSYNSYHQSGELYGPSPMAFIQKPYNECDIDNIVGKAATRILPAQKMDSYFTFEYNRKKYSISKSDIIYIECQLRQKMIYTTEKEYRLNANMKEIIKNIDAPEFILIHRSFLVNMHFIDSISSNEVVCKTGQRLPVSAGYYKNARWELTQLLERQNRGTSQHV